MRAKLIYEKFSEDSDPISDMGIGIIEQIKKEYKERYSWKKEEPSNKDLFSYVISGSYGSKQQPLEVIESVLKTLSEEERKQVFNPKRTWNIMYAIGRPDSVELFKMYTKYGAGPAIQHDKNDMFVSAINKSDNKLAKWLFSNYKINVNYRYCKALYLAAARGNTEGVKFLLKNGADASLKNHRALQAAVAYGKKDTSIILMKDYIKRK